MTQFCLLPLGATCVVRDQAFRLMVFKRVLFWHPFRSEDQWRQWQERVLGDLIVDNKESLSEWSKLELLGAGGNGEVWRANRNDVEYALKILNKSLLAKICG